MVGPLSGYRIVELAGLGPGPFCGMMLADHGAEVIRIDRIGAAGLLADPRRDVLNRSRRGLAVDLKQPAGVALVRRLCAGADGMFEGFRPGVAERLGLGPDVLLGDNPRLVYGRMTGWGQDGPWAAMAGHDINYIALSGALHAIGREGGPPSPPLNLVGDFGGGGMMLAFGMLAALLNVQRTGRGQVVDCAMTEGSALLMAMIYSLRAQGLWRDRRGVNLLDSGSCSYDAYETADGLHLAAGPVEPQFFRLFVEGLGLGDDPAFDARDDPRRWPELKAKIAARVLTRTRAEWMAVFEGTDACVAPVLSMAEAPDHPHNRARGAFVEVDGAVQPAPAPRYSRTPSAPPAPLAGDEAAARAILAGAGLDGTEIDDLRHRGVIGWDQSQDPEGEA